MRARSRSKVIPWRTFRPTVEPNNPGIFDDFEVDDAGIITMDITGSNGFNTDDGAYWQISTGLDPEDWGGLHVHFDQISGPSNAFVTVGVRHTTGIASLHGVGTLIDSSLLTPRARAEAPAQSYNTGTPDAAGARVIGAVTSQGGLMRHSRANLYGASGRIAGSSAEQTSGLNPKVAPDDGDGDLVISFGRGTGSGSEQITCRILLAPIGVRMDPFGDPL